MERSAHKSLPELIPPFGPAACLPTGKRRGVAGLGGSGGVL